MAVFIPDQIREAMLVHAHNCHPMEACGLLAGRGSDLRMAYPLTNTQGSETAYTVDHTEHYRALKHAESRGWELIGVFHSHPSSAAYPSPTDVRLALDPQWLYLIIGMERGPEIRGFRIEAGRISEEELFFSGLGG
jgi:proteasome lid subunit RPN8/RPN11